MNTYGYNLDTTHQAIIFELGTEAADSSKLHHRFTPGAIVGSSQFGIIEEMRRADVFQRYPYC